jgi:multiple sugar transport system permease protein
MHRRLRDLADRLDAGLIARREFLRKSAVITGGTAVGLHAMRRATHFGAFRRVILPLAAPGLLAAALYAFTQAWNEFLYALVFVTDVKQRTLPVGLSSFITGDVYGWGYLMAGAVLTTLPVIAVYIYLQKYMVEGLTAGGVKG